MSMLFFSPWGVLSSSLPRADRKGQGRGASAKIHRDRAQAQPHLRDTNGPGLSCHVGGPRPLPSWAERKGRTLWPEASRGAFNFSVNWEFQ